MTWRERIDAVWLPVKRWYDGHAERDRRIIGVVVVAALLSLLYVGIFVPLRERRAQVAQEIEQGLVRVQHGERLVASAAALEAERSDLRRRLKTARRRLLPGGSETLGAAALQERANALATENRVTVRTTQVLRGEPATPYRRVSVRLTLSGALDGIAAMAAGLEYDHQLTIPFLELSRRGAVATAGKAVDISATMEVAGFVAGDDDGAGEGEEADPDDFVGPRLPDDDGAAAHAPDADGESDENEAGETAT